MRLSDQQRESIIQAANSCLPEDAEVWLFGSRCNNADKGGDIDLFIDTPPLEDVFLTKSKLKLLLEDLLGEQKIDLLIHEQGQAELPIHQAARKNGILLKGCNTNKQ